MLRTKLAQRLNNEFKNKLHLSADHADMLAAGIDNGSLKAGQARMIAGLSADWMDAAVIDAVSGLKEMDSTSPNARAQQAKKREMAGVISSIFSMAEQMNLDTSELREALITHIGVGFESHLSADQKHKIAGVK